MDSLSLALGQISFAVNDLTKKNYKATIKEVHEVNIMDYRGVTKFSFIPQLGAHIRFIVCFYRLRYLILAHMQ